MDLTILKRLRRFIKTLEIANSIPILMVLSECEEATTSQINKLLTKNVGIAFSGNSLTKTLFSLKTVHLIDYRVIKNPEGKVLKRYFWVTEKGKKIVGALKIFLQELEKLNSGT